MTQKRKELCFRVETEEKVGMYNTNYRQQLQAYNEKYSAWIEETCANHPTPSSDSKLGWESIRGSHRYYFGFNTMEQLRRWLFEQKLIDELPNYDLAVSIYETDDYHIGDTQMVFKLMEATRIGRFILT